MCCSAIVLPHVILRVTCHQINVLPFALGGCHVSDSSKHAANPLLLMLRSRGIPWVTLVSITLIWRKRNVYREMYNFNFIIGFNLNVLSLLFCFCNLRFIKMVLTYVYLKWLVWTIGSITSKENFKDFGPNKQWNNTIKSKPSNCMQYHVSRTIYAALEVDFTESESGGGQASGKAVISLESRQLWLWRSLPWHYHYLGRIKLCPELIILSFPEIVQKYFW